MKKIQSCRLLEIPFSLKGRQRSHSPGAQAPKQQCPSGQWINSLEPQCFRTGDLRIVSGQGLSPAFLKVRSHIPCSGVRTSLIPLANLDFVLITLNFTECSCLTVHLSILRHKIEQSGFRTIKRISRPELMEKYNDAFFTLFCFNGYWHSHVMKLVRSPSLPVDINDGRGQWDIGFQSHYIFSYPLSKCCLCIVDLHSLRNCQLLHALAVFHPGAN